MGGSDVDDGGDLRRQAGPHVFVNDLESLELDDHDRHHLDRVLRLRPGDPMTVSDGRGAWRRASFGAHVTATGPVVTVAEPAYSLSLAVALTKGAKPEFAVQKATEVGVDRIVVFHATYSVARWNETKRSKIMPRLAKVAREAAMQSRRVQVPVVEFVDSLVDVEAPGAVVRADFGGNTPISDVRCIAIGPEGGWSDDERSAVPASVDLGLTVLRAETAAVVAAAFVAQARPR